MAENDEGERRTKIEGMMYRVIKQVVDCADSHDSVVAETRAKAEEDKANGEDLRKKLKEEKEFSRDTKPFHQSAVEMAWYDADLEDEEAVDMNRAKSKYKEFALVRAKKLKPDEAPDELDEAQL